MKENYGKLISLLLVVCLLGPCLTGLAEDGRVSTVYVQVHQNGGTFNPWGSNQDPFMFTRLNFYETLFQWLPGGEMAPLLVEDYGWTDELTMKIKLRDNIIGHAGNQITESDVLFSFEKALETSEYGRHAKNVDFENSYVVGDLNLVIAILAPSAFFYNGLSRVSIVSQKSYEESDDDMVNMAISSGPYKMVSYTSGYEWVLKKFEDY